MVDKIHLPGCPSCIDTPYLLPIPHSHQNLACPTNGVDYSRFIDNETAEELLTLLLRQLNFWCEYGIREEQQAQVLTDAFFVHLW